MTPILYLGGQPTYMGPTVPPIRLTDDAGNLMWKLGADGLISGPITWSGVTLPRPKFINMFGAALAQGVTVMQDAATGAAYTVPAGRKALITTWMMKNANAGTSTAVIKLVSGGSSYQIDSSQSLTTGTATTGGAAPIILNPDEQISVTVGTTDGLNVWFQVIEFDAVAPILRSGLLGIASGDNTYYTCPAGKTAAVLAQRPMMDSLSAVFNVNASGGSLNLTHYVIPSGGTKGTDNMASPSTSLADVTRVATTVRPTLGPGDSVLVNWSGANAAGAGWVNVLELPTEGA